MSEEDKDEARHKELIERMERHREKSAQEHGAIVTVVRDQNRETRDHIGNEMETVRANTDYAKTRMQKLINAFKRFLERHGMRSDDLDD